MVSLSTRNTAQREVLAIFNNVSTIMMTGIFVTLIFPMAIMPALGARNVDNSYVNFILYIFTTCLT